MNAVFCIRAWGFSGDSITYVIMNYKGEYFMHELLLYLFGLHGATEIGYTIDDEEIATCPNSSKVID